MDFLTKIYSDFETEPEQVQKANKAAFYTLMNFLEAYDGYVSEQEIQKRFLYRKDYSAVFQKLVDNSVVENKDGFYKLNPQAKTFISPLLENLMSLVYTPEKKVTTTDPSLNLLYNCRSELFSS